MHKLLKMILRKKKKRKSKHTGGTLNMPIIFEVFIFQLFNLQEIFFFFFNTLGRKCNFQFETFGLIIRSASIIELLTCHTKLDL